MNYREQARFWIREGARRGPIAAASWLTPALNTRLVRALEDRARPRDLDIRNAIPRVQEVLVRTHVLSPPELSYLPPVPPILGEDGYWFQGVRVHQLSGALLDVDSGLVFARTWVINGSGTGQRWSMDSAFLTGAAVRVYDGDVTDSDTVVAPLGNCVEHYHFLMETLPQVLRVRQVAPDAVFLTSEVPLPFAQRTLSDLGVTFRVVERGQVLRCSSLYYCEGFPRERTHPADMQLLVDTFVGEKATRTQETTGRLYISRSRSLRALADEGHLESELAARGFTILHLEDLPFEEQVGHLSRAEIVVAAHGAGLANTVFMPPGGRVIEYTSGEWWSNAFRRISHARRHEYELLLIPTAPSYRWGRAKDVEEMLSPVLESLAD